MLLSNVPKFPFEILHNLFLFSGAHEEQIFVPFRVEQDDE